MQTLAGHSGLIAFAAVTSGAGFLAARWHPLEPRHPLELAVLIALAVVTAAVERQQSIGDGRPAMRPSFVIYFTSLLLFGTGVTMLVAAAGSCAQEWGRARRPHFTPRNLLGAAATLGGLQAAGLVHRGLGGTLGHFEWPYQGLPLTAAVAAYCIVVVLAAQVAAPLLARRPLQRRWPPHVLHDCSIYYVGAGFAVGLVEVIDHHVWEILPIAALPLYFTYRAYGDYLDRLGDEHRRTEVIDSLDQGMSIVDGGGRVTLWNDALERILSCPRDRALGRSLTAAVPTLSSTDLPRVLQEALADRSPRTLSYVGLPSSPISKILHVKIVPVTGGATLLWQDVTEQVRAEHALKRSQERLALAAEGANDGLWEWDLRTQEFYVSGRWAEMIGRPAIGRIGRAEDWLERVHPDDLARLKEAFNAHLAGTTDLFEHEHRMRHENGTYRWFLSRGIALQGSNGKPARIAGSLTDTTDRALARERLRSTGFLDPLTGLRNRADFVEGLGRRLEEFKRQRSTGRFAVIYLDLDRFKVVNDSLGHLVGDELLVAVSRRLESCLRQGDALARLGGDEFAILLNTVATEQQANAVAMRIQDALSAPVRVGEREVFTSASIGIAFAHPQYANPDEIMRDADTAMYEAKQRGKARHELFDADMHARVRDRLGMENDLRHAVGCHALEVHYQPIVSLTSGMCVGFESLLRWTRNGTAVPPASFIPLAEEVGLIEPLGTWVLQEACRTFADWKRRYPDAGLDCITVNASSRQLTQQNFLSIVEEAVRKAGLRPSDLRLEITETALMDSPHIAAEVLRELRSFGVKIYLDDFGTGYSSLSHLHTLPVDALKIDRSFVRSLQLPDRPLIVESILALARTLNTSVVAEGIESDLQARELERLGCTHAQGYLFSRPLSMRCAEQLIVAGQPLGPKQPVADGAKRDDEIYYSSKPFTWLERSSA